MLPASVPSLVASIPSPSFSVFELGPLNLRLYGLCIALGVIAAVTISSKRWEARGGNPDDIGTIAIWAVPAGVIGSRMYHVATDWKKYQDDWLQAFNITNGGLGIPGGVAAGVLVGLIVVKVKKLPAAPLLDVVAPAIPVAQAIGRLGNWFNQELFGRPTTLPWGLEVDAEHKVAAGYSGDSGVLFHPTFLYEALWNLALAGLLIVLDRKKKLRPGELFTLYVLGYAIGRLWVEELRIDPASLIWGVRVNIWMSVIVGGVAAIVFARNRLRPAPPAADGAGGSGSSGGGSETAALAGSDSGSGDEDEDRDRDGDAAADAPVADRVVLGGRRPVDDAASTSTTSTTSVDDARRDPVEDQDGATGDDEVGPSGDSDPSDAGSSDGGSSDSGGGGDGGGGDSGGGGDGGGGGGGD